MSKKLLVAGLVCSFLWGCTQVEYSNPIDARGVNYVGDSLAGDHDNDGIANMYDEDSPFYVRDTIPPTITILEGLEVTIPVESSEKIAYYARKVVAVDNIDGDITDSVKVTNNISIYIPGTYTMTYTVSDKDNNTATATRTVIVQAVQQEDKTPPVITIHGSQTIFLTVGDPFQEPDVTAYDDVDKALPASSITKQGSVNTSVAGTYTITYTATDNSGNSSSKAITVTVEEDNGQDLIPPVITLIGPDTIQLQAGQSYEEPGFQAIDNRDGDITQSVTVTNNIRSTAGTYHVNYSVADAAGNAITKRRTVIVIGGGGLDIVPPVITLTGKERDTITLGSTWTEPGYAATDNVDGVITNRVIISVVPVNPTGTVNTSVVGTYTITYTVTDEANNSATLKRYVTVIEGGTVGDKIAPVLTLTGKDPDTVTVSATGSYTDPGCTAIDDVDGNITSSIVKTGTVNMALAGSYTLTYTVSDAAGNSATKTRTVVVKAAASGDLLTKYSVPSSSPLPATLPNSFPSFSTEGTAPNLTLLKGLGISWSNSQLYHFQLEYNGDPWSKPFTPVQTFASPNPSITLESSGITGLDGQYYVVMDGTNFVWVRTDGSFAIIWTP